MTSSETQLYLVEQVSWLIKDTILQRQGPSKSYLVAILKKAQWLSKHAVAIEPKA